MEHQIQYFRKTYLDHAVVLLKSNTETIKAKKKRNNNFWIQRKQGNIEHLEIIHVTATRQEKESYDK